MNTQPTGGDVSEPRTGGASKQAWRAAHDSLDATDGRDWAGATRSTMVNLILDAAHSPALGLDRSVRLREVVDLLRAEAGDLRDGYWDGVRFAADFIAREFGKGV